MDWKSVDTAFQLLVRASPIPKHIPAELNLNTSESSFGKNSTKMLASSFNVSLGTLPSHVTGSAPRASHHESILSPTAAMKSAPLTVQMLKQLKQRAESSFEQGNNSSSDGHSSTLRSPTETTRPERSAHVSQEKISPVKNIYEEITSQKLANVNSETDTDPDKHLDEPPHPKDQPDSEGHQGDPLEDRGHDNQCPGDEGPDMKENEHDTEEDEDIVYSQAIATKPTSDETEKHMDAKDVDKKKEYVLQNWTIRPLKNGSICVEGEKLNDDGTNELWHSTGIESRIDNRHITTASGSVYILQGYIDTETAADYGISKTLMQRFKSGFPPPWRALWEEFIQAKKAGVNTSKRLSDSSSKTNEKTFPKLKRHYKGKDRQLKDVTLVNKRNSRPGSSTKKWNDKKETTPNNIVKDTIDLGQLPKTRSGRRVVPVLAWWTGQRITGCDESVFIQPGTPNLLLGTKVKAVKEDEREMRLFKRRVSSAGQGKKKSKVRTDSSIDTTAVEKSDESVEETLKSRKLRASIEDPQASFEDMKSMKKSKRLSKGKRGVITIESDSESENDSLKENRDITAKDSGTEMGDHRRHDEISHTQSESEGQSNKESQNKNRASSPMAKRKRGRPRAVTLDSSDGKRMKKSKRLSKGKGRANAIESDTESENDSLKENRDDTAKDNETIMKGHRRDDESSHTQSELESQSNNERQHKECAPSPMAKRKRGRPITVTVDKRNGIRTRSSDRINSLRRQCSDLPDNVSRYKLTKEYIRRGVSDSKSSLNVRSTSDSNLLRSATGSKKVTKRSTSKYFKKDTPRDWSESEDNYNVSDKGKGVRKSRVETSRETQNCDMDNRKVKKSAAHKSYPHQFSSEPSSLNSPSNDVVDEDDILMRSIIRDKSNLQSDITGMLEGRRNMLIEQTPLRRRDFNLSSIHLENVVQTKNSSDKYFLKKALMKNVSPATQQKILDDSPFVNMNRTTKNASSSTETVDRAKKRARSLPNKNHESSSDDDYEPNMRNVSEPRRRKPRKKNSKSVSDLKKNIEPSKNSGTAPGTTKSTSFVWKEDEINRLNKAVSEIPRHMSEFWDLVACVVKTRSAEECRLFRQAQTEKGQSKPAKKNNTSMLNATEITGGVGTLKRKRQLRELVENHEKGQTDDFFDATPFKKRSRCGKLGITDESDSEYFTTHGSRFQTPGVKTPGGWMATPANKTPGSFFSPGVFKSVDRNAVDQYMNRAKKGKRRFQTTSRSKEPNLKVSGHTVTSLGGMTSALFTLREEEQEEEVEEEEDFYFSDC